MKYQIKKLNINNFSVFEENKLAARSYFIPYSSKEKLLQQNVLTERYNSELVTVLSGEWKFRYYEKISRLPANIDTDVMNFDSVNVPSTWQRTGYQSPCYLNTRYEFPMTLPVVPDEMSVGVYSTSFTINNAKSHPVITFLGVCSSLTLYVNGNYVGYSEGSHNSAEFDLDGLVHEGENELLAVVSRWCNGTYLECQDMFRENGIFRDVYVTENPEFYVFDYDVKTFRKGDGYGLTLSVKPLCFDREDCTISAEISKDGKTIAELEKSAEAKTVFNFSEMKVSEWSAETPELYDLIITVKDSKQTYEYIRERIGFRTVRIDGEKFLFNEKLIKFKGVNHHDTHHINGYVMSGEDLLKDVTLMKEYNVNAVRMSHYPPDPILIRLCDEYGLYVIDEADIETHGTQVDLDLKFTAKPNLISNDKEWLPRMRDRVLRLYHRDKNHPSITMWSLGNESGGWKNQDACYDMLKNLSELPVHYEGVIRTPRGSYDVISEMYQHPMVVKKIGEHKFLKRYKNKPYYLCEYCHAMGVGPGALEDYWEIIYAHDNLTGGCIWEWADHSVYDENAKYKYTYGGDHGEAYHDDNFCVDGLFYPNRTPHTGAYEMREVYRPIRCQRMGSTDYIFKNTNAFLAADIYNVKFELLKNGVVAETGDIALSAAAGESEKVSLNYSAIDENNDWHINFVYTDKNGNYIAKEQIALYEKVKEIEKANGKVNYEKKSDRIVVKFDGGEAVFSKDSGALMSYKLDGKEMLSGSKGFTPNVYRAYLDNDRNIVKGWKKAGYDKLENALKFEEVKEKDGGIQIECEGALKADGKTVFESEIKYTVYADGTIKVKTELERKGFIFNKKADIPRFGLNVHLDESLNNVKYFGLGDKENLPDFDAQSTVGVYEAKVSELNVDYIKPQDNGNHGKTRFASFTDENGKGLEFVNCNDYFSFSAHRYTEETICNSRHIEDIKDDGLVSVNIDGFMRGTGTNSCGPDTLGKYKIDFKKELEFSFYIVPKK